MILTFEVFRGSINKSMVSPYEGIFKRTILNNACGIILAHNHPFGELTPLLEDKSIIDRLKNGEILGIIVVEYIIIANNKYSSLREEGMI